MALLTDVCVCLFLVFIQRDEEGDFILINYFIFRFKSLVNNTRISKQA